MLYYCPHRRHIWPMAPGLDVVAALTAQGLATGRPVPKRLCPSCGTPLRTERRAHDWRRRQEAAERKASALGG